MPYGVASRATGVDPGTRVAVRVPKQSPLHQLGCPDWYEIRSMADASLASDDAAPSRA